jgi:hypothetical protein
MYAGVEMRVGLSSAGSVVRGWMWAASGLAGGMSGSSGIGESIIFSSKLTCRVMAFGHFIYDK